jgi:hypothetical protein
VLPTRTLDSKVIDAWAARCSEYRRRTKWLRPMALFVVVGAPMSLLLAFGMPAASYAFASFAVGMLLSGVFLSLHTSRLVCPHCGKRPILLTHPYRAPLYAKSCEHCMHWLVEPASPMG